MNDCEFIRVVTRDEEECFLLTKLKNDGQEGFDLTLCHNGRVWTGSVSEDDLDTMCSRLKIQFNKYVKETVEALTNTDSKHTFQYELKRSKDKAEFAWKKHVPDEDITFQLGSVALKPCADSPQMITRIYNHCIEKLGELKTRINSLETDNQRLSQERVNALKRLEKCVVAKEELENDLYLKFSLVLNSKKEKIRELKEQVQDGVVPTKVTKQSPDEGTESAVTGVKRLRTGTQSAKTQESDSGENTDEETPKSKRSRPSVQKKRDSGGDDSLILDNDDDAESGPSVSRPRRQRGRQQKKQIPAKPVLPRVGSGDSTPGSERKPRLRKNGSNNSNKSSENIDADDLLGDL